MIIMNFYTALIIIGIYVALLKGGVVKRHTHQQHKNEHETEQDENSIHAGLDFFQRFQSLFGWGEETTPSVPKITKIPARPSLARVPSHRHLPDVQEPDQPSHTPTIAPTRYPSPVPVHHPPPPRPQYQRHPQATIGQYYNHPQKVQVPPPPYPYPSPYVRPPYYPQYPHAQYKYPVYSTPAPISQTTNNIANLTEPIPQNKIPSGNIKIPNKHRALPNKNLYRKPVRKVPFALMESSLPESVLPQEDCHTREGDLGACMSASKCGETNGYPSGLCHMGRDVSLHVRVCCIYPAYCGFESSHRVTYFKSPSYPATTIKLSSCPYTVNLLPGVCQIRLDFLDFQMKPLHQGVCDANNVLSVKSSHRSTLIPLTKLCGKIATGDADPLRTDVPHMYVHFDTDPVFSKESAQVLPNKDISNSPPSLQMHFNVTNFPSKWNIRVSQIACDGANLQAPAGCSQYYNSNSGNITSFNLLDREYMTQMSIDACIARDPTACAIKYSLKTMEVGPTKGGGLGYGLVCGDYVKFKGEKTGICGNGSGRDLVLPVRGPMGLSFSSDGIHIPQADVGFKIEYAYQHQCKNLQFFNYPTSKM